MSQDQNTQDRPEIEVTPEMIEAGFKVLSASGIADDYLEADKLWVADIFRAMIAEYMLHQK